MSGTMGLIIEQRQQGSCDIVKVDGDLDQETLPAFTSVVDSTIAESACPHIVVDMSAIGTLDSATLSVMLKAKQFANSLRRQLWFLIQRGSSADRLLSAANLLNHLGVIYELDRFGPKPRPVPERLRRYTYH